MSTIAFKDLHFNDYERVVRVSDAKSGLKAFIAIHNTNLGPAMGGCRLWNYSNEELAITDALRLSRGMSYKNAVAGLPIGGGKCVIMGTPGREKSPAQFEALGEALERLGGTYITAEDVGTTPQDMSWVATRTKYVGGLGADGDPSPYTALGCFVGAQAAINFRFKRHDFDGLTVAVQGLGHVGYELAKLLHKAGANLIVADINTQSLERARAEFNAQIVDVEAIYDAEADIYAPCALGATLNINTMKRLKVKIIAGAANNQLAATEIGELLKARGILYAPDYVINAGGIIKVCYEYFKKPAILVDAHILEVKSTLLNIFALAELNGTSTSAVADEMALAKIARAKALSLDRLSFEYSKIGSSSFATEGRVMMAK